MQRNSVRSVSSFTGALNGRKCIITGASRGIGKAIAERFANEGAACVLVSRNADALNDLARELPTAKDNDEGAGHVHSVQAGDISQRSFWETAAKEIVGITSKLLNGCADFVLERCRYTCECGRGGALFSTYEDAVKTS